MALKLITGPVCEPVSLAEAKLHLRVDATADDALIVSKIQTAREDVETITRRALITQTWELVLDAFPSKSTLKLPLPPLQSVVHIKYMDVNAVENTFVSSNYAVDTDSEPGRIALVSGASWPGDTLYAVNGVRIRFVAGFGGQGSDLPEKIRAAMLLLVGHYYENREASSQGVHILPMGVYELLATYRVWVF